MKQSSWLGALVILGLLGLAASLNATRPDDFYALSQEDGVIEWWTVWSFLIAALAHLQLASERHGLARSFGLLLAMFCGVVAMEEVSWGQRLLGVQSPNYFLDSNAQQELNLHNQVPDRARIVALQLILLAYAALPLLPLLGRRWRPIARVADQLGVVPPPPVLGAAFAALLLFYLSYPFKFAGEWVELSLGIGLVAGAWPGPGRLLPALAISLGLAGSTGPVLEALRPVDPEAASRVAVELAAIHDDWRAGRLRTECGLHRRLFHVVEDAGLDGMRSGDFATLHELAEERAQFFLDPWAQPYWVMDRCEDDGGRRLNVYSFGPNRRRDSTRWETRGDDVVETILEWRPPPEEEL